MWEDLQNEIYLKPHEKGGYACSHGHEEECLVDMDVPRLRERHVICLRCVVSMLRCCQAVPVQPPADEEEGE